MLTLGNQQVQAVQQRHDANLDSHWNANRTPESITLDPADEQHQELPTMQSC